MLCMCFLKEYNLSYEIFKLYYKIDIYIYFFLNINKTFNDKKNLQTF